MKTLVALCAAALLIATSVSAQTPPADSKTAVSRLLESVRTTDRALYAQVGSGLFIFAAPDFAVPVTFDQAQKLFGGCSLTSLSDPKPLEGAAPASIVTATMTCGPPLPQGPLTIDFMADEKVVHAVYPGGYERFYPKGKTPRAVTVVRP